MQYWQYCQIEWVCNGHTYSFKLRDIYGAIYRGNEYSNGPEILSGDIIELGGWIEKDGSYYPNQYNTYMDLLVE